MRRAGIAQGVMAVLARKARIELAITALRGFDGHFKKGGHG
jgi:hypothetical protein